MVQAQGVTELVCDNTLKVDIHRPSCRPRPVRVDLHVELGSRTERAPGAVPRAGDGQYGPRLVGPANRVLSVRPATPASTSTSTARPEPREVKVRTEAPRGGSGADSPECRAGNCRWRIACVVSPVRRVRRPLKTAGNVLRRKRALFQFHRAREARNHFRLRRGEAGAVHLARSVIQHEHVDSHKSNFPAFLYTKKEVVILVSWLWAGLG